MLIHAPVPGQGTLRLRTRTLALCLSTALATSGLAASATQATMPGPAAARNPATQAPTQTWLVGNCADSGPGSLRDVIATQAQSGDTVDLSQLPMSCGMANSLITLGSEIVVGQDDLTLLGPMEGTVTISGARNSRVFHHTGNGTIALNTMIVSEGYFQSPGAAYGGCIHSDNGNVLLNRVTVSDCTVVSDNDDAKGGGISTASGNVLLIASRISGNEVVTSNNSGWGGGVYSSGATVAIYSSISGNINFSTSNCVGGGITTTNGVTLIASTVTENISPYGGGVFTFNGLTNVFNSTISKNKAGIYGGALYIIGSALTVANSTIAFNHQGATDSGSGGILFGGGNGSVLTLQSSIVANNTAGIGDAPADIFVGQGSVVGADNLVMASNISSPGVIAVTTDPKLGPLQSNGGPTRTHALLPGSPAVGMGNADGLPVAFEDIDQRGTGYPRATGPSASVDIGAVQFDSIFADSFNWAF